MLSYAISNLDAYLPSMACLRGEAYDFVVSTAAQLIPEIKLRGKGRLNMQQRFGCSTSSTLRSCFRCVVAFQGLHPSVLSNFPGRKQSTFGVAASMQPSRRGSRSVPASWRQQRAIFTGRHAHRSPEGSICSSKSASCVELLGVLEGYV